MLTPIRIYPLTPVPMDVITSIVHPLRMIFPTKISIEEPLIDLVDAAYDDSRIQYNSTQIITDLNILVHEAQTKILGITSVDLFVPILTYVFGEAQLAGKTCVVSTYRLDNSIYGLPIDPVLYFERTLKEAVHELGHTYGLYHCKHLECAMHTSTAVEDIDVKESVLCNDCRRRIGL